MALEVLSSYSPYSWFRADRASSLPSFSHFTSWDLEEIESVDYEMGGADDPQHILGSAGNEIRMNTEESEEVMLGCDQSDIPDFVAEARKRLSEQGRY